MGRLVRLSGFEQTNQMRAGSDVAVIDHALKGEPG